MTRREVKAIPVEGRHLWYGTHLWYCDYPTSHLRAVEMTDAAEEVCA